MPRASAVTLPRSPRNLQSCIVRFDVESCIAVLERACPDYRGLHVNLYDLLLPYEDELLLAAFRASFHRFGP